MCGRFTLFPEETEIMEIIRQIGNIEIKTGEIFPTNRVPVLLSKENKIIPDVLTWGFPNFRSKGVLINARAETVTEKRTFRDSLFRRRCVIPSTGFYEWDKEKRKYRFREPGKTALYMAGLYNGYDDANRFVILTTAANQSMADIHNRMPVIIKKECIEEWITDDTATGLFLIDQQPELEKELEK